MPADLAADTGLLEDVHGLPQHRGLVSDGPQDSRKEGQAAEISELRHPVVQSMADLVDGCRLGPGEPAIGVQRILLQEAMHGFGGVHEIAVAAFLAVQRREHRPVTLDSEGVDDARGRRAQGLDFPFRDHALADCIAALLVFFL